MSNKRVLKGNGNSMTLCQYTHWRDADEGGASGCMLQAETIWTIARGESLPLRQHGKGETRVAPDLEPASNQKLPWPH